MERILKAIQDKNNMGYSNNQLEVDFGSINIGTESETTTEGYYLSKLNGWGVTPITELLALDGEINDKALIEELDKLDIAHCF